MQQARAEGLKLRAAATKTGYFGVSLDPGRNLPSYNPVPITTLTLPLTLTLALTRWASTPALPSP